MAGHNSSIDSGSSAEEKSCVMHPVGHACENSMWEEWTQASNGDEVSTSSFLPELNPSNSRLSFQQSDMLSTWMSSFQPLSHNSLSPDLSHSPDPVDHPPAFMQEGLDPDHSLTDLYARNNSKPSDSLIYSVPSSQSEAVYSDSSFVKSRADSSHNVDGKSSPSRQLLQALGPQSPSSPLAIQNGLLNPFGDPWDGSHSNLAWPPLTTVSGTGRSFIPDHSPSAISHLEGLGSTSRYGLQLSRPRHTDIFIGSDGIFESTTGGWTPQFYNVETTGSSVTPMKLMACLREGAEATSVCTESKLPVTTGLGQSMSFMRGEDRTTSTKGCTISSILAECKRAGSGLKQVWPGKHRLELVEVDGEDAKNPPLKRPNLAVDHANALWSDQTLRGAELRSYSASSGTSLASQAMDIIAVGPALNTNGKPRARRGSATDPQSVYARHRRERINERLKTLQHLVPNGAKVDIVTMLEEAINYVKFLQHQVKLLRSDDFWMYATPNTYNGMDISNLPAQPQGLESSA